MPLDSPLSKRHWEGIQPCTVRRVTGIIVSNISLQLNMLASVCGLSAGEDLIEQEK